MAVSREEFENLKKLPYFKSQIVSDSMSPIIKVGDRVIVEVGNPNLKRFDIIVIFLDGKLVCHYIWKINSIFKPIIIQTRNIHRQLDIPITMEDYLGKVVSQRLTFWQKIKLIWS